MTEPAIQGLVPKVTLTAVAHDPVNLAAVRRVRTGDNRRAGRFLKGPIPWDWVIATAQLPGKALIIGLCLWRLSGAMKSRSVMLGNRELAPFGIDRPTKSRGLATLEKAGLIKVDRKAGRWPTVTLLA